VPCLPPDDQADTIDVGPVRGIPIIDDDDPRFESERRAWSLARAKAQAMHSADELLGGLRDDDWMVRHEVVDRLIARAGKDPRTGPALVAAAQDPAWQVRDEVVLRLRYLGPDGIEAIRAALNDEHPDVRDSARLALEMLGEDA
jgi:HEAT repeat protein